MTDKIIVTADATKRHNKHNEYADKYLITFLQNVDLTGHFLTDKLKDFLFKGMKADLST